MHAGPFFIKQRRRAQNATSVAVSGGVENEYVKMYVSISRPLKLWRKCTQGITKKTVFFYTIITRIEWWIVSISADDVVDCTWWM